LFSLVQLIRMLYTRLSFYIAFLCFVISSFEAELSKQLFILKLKQKVSRQTLEKIVTGIQFREGPTELSDTFNFDVALQNGSPISKYFKKTRELKKKN
jgi:hypothetical protein